MEEDGARAGGMTGLDRRLSFVCQPEFHGRLGEMSEVVVVAIIAVAIIAGHICLSCLSWCGGVCYSCA